VIIDLYGDSTQASTVQWDGAIIQNQITPAKYLQMRCDSCFGKDVHTVRNKGVGGTTLVGAINTAYYSGRTLYQDIATQGAGMIVPNWGVNESFDANYNTNHHLWNYTSLKNYAEGLGKTFVFETPNPIWDSNVGAHLAQLRALTASVRTIPGLKIAEVLANIEGYYPQWAAHLDQPKIHPNSIMTPYIGEILFNTIKPYLA